jgi:hypothetical protein
VEKVASSEVLEVPRTGLLLVGKVKPLVPLPARASANQGLSRENSLGPVQQQQLDATATDVGMVPSMSVHGGSPAYSNSTPSIALGGTTLSNSCGALNKGSSSALLSSSSTLSSSSSSSSQILQGNNHQPFQASDHGACNLMKSGSLQDDGRGTGSVFAGKQQEMQPLVAPAELPPGEFICMVEAIVLQVPRGPEVPSQLETMSYQAHVSNAVSKSGNSSLIVEWRHHDMQTLKLPCHFQLHAA